MKDSKPSQVTEEYWIHAINKKINSYAPSRDNCGKWMIFAYKGRELNNIWKEVKQKTETGLLGSSSKVSTMKENPNATSKDTGIICVYTYDSNDKADLKRIAKELFKIKDVIRLLYKEDKATHEGKYSIRGDKKICKWVITKENFEEVLGD